jgi:hypothetical protein
MKTRLVLFLATAALAALAIAGCGGGSDSSSSDPASLAPATAPVYIEATVQPQGEMKANVESLVQRVAGIDNIGDKVVEEVEKAAQSSDEPFDYGKDVQPWLGEKAGLFLQRYDGQDFTGVGAALAVTDADAAQEFIDQHAKSDSGQPLQEGSYEGNDYKFDAGEETVLGTVGDFLVIAEDVPTFKAMVDASNGESLADEETFSSTTAAVPGGSLADVFVDIGGLIEQAGTPVDDETLQILEDTGIKASEATAVASLVPGSDQIEIDFSSDLAGENPPSGDASKLLGSLPGGSFAAFASSEFGKRFGEAIDQIDADGIPGQIPPNKLKDTMKAAGIDLEKLGSSVSDLGVFAQGNTERNLTGAVVLTTKGAQEATNTVANIGLLLRASGTPGVTAISGKATGFSVRSPDLGSQPLVVAAKGERIAISYGLAASAQALTATKGATLAEDPAYKEAVAALGSTPISGFVDGPAALQLASDLVPAGEEDFLRAKPYLAKVDYVAIGSVASGDQATAKLIVGIGK